MPFTFESEEYADMVYVLGVCDGNANAAVNEYRRRFPNRRVPIPRTFRTTYQTLRQRGYLPSFQIIYERTPQHEVHEDENIINAI